jgi:hypothetical protein
MSNQFYQLKHFFMKTYAYKLKFVFIFVLFTYIMKAQTTVTEGVLVREPLDTNLIIAPPPVGFQSCDTCSKEIYLIHGLAGNGNTWKNVDEALLLGTHGMGSYKISRVKKLDYSDPQYSHSLFSMAEKINSDILQYQLAGTEGPNNTFLFAHSQGGLVTRELNYRNMTQTGSIDIRTRRTGPVFTFGTPHQGAQILNNIDPNGKKMAHTFIQEACSKLGKAEANIILKDFWLASFLNTNYLDDIVSVSCNTLTNTGINLMFKDMMIPATAEYRVGAQKINELNAVNRTVPYLLFYGVEEDPVFWRTLESYTYEYPLATLPDPFGLDPDQNGVTKFNNMRNRYLTNRIASQILANEHLRNGVRLSNPFLAVTTGGHSLIRAALHFQSYQDQLGFARTYKDAEVFVENANEKWERIIGARVGNPITVQNGYYCRCWNENIPNLGTTVTWVQNQSDCIPANSATTCNTLPARFITTLVKPNDGVVLAESAKTLSGAVVAPTMPYTNHQQMRNSGFTRIGLKKAFQGVYGTNFLIMSK